MELSKRTAAVSTTLESNSMKKNSTSKDMYIDDSFDGTWCQLERNPTKNIRHRNKSCSSNPASFSTSREVIFESPFKKPPFGYASASPSSILTTPVHELDCGFVSSPDSGYNEFKASPIGSDWTKKASILVSDGKKKWKRYNSSLYNHTIIKGNPLPFRPLEILPVCLVLIVIGSVFFTICALNNALNKSYRNLKYGSIDYEHSKLKTITDENGNILTGKKAAIQFYYDRTYPNELSNKSPEEMDIEKGEFVDSPKADSQVEIPRITMDTVNEVMKMLDKIEKQVKERNTNRELLLKKLSEFGHFGTSVVKPLDLEVELIDNPEEQLQEKIKSPEKSKLKRTKRGSSYTLNDDPFRFFSNQAQTIIDEDFRYSDQ